MRLGLLLSLPLCLAVVPAATAREDTPHACLREYLEKRTSPRALDMLRDCAARFPDSYLVQKSLGLRLAREAEKLRGPDPLRLEAIRHLTLASELDASQFADYWTVLAKEQDEAARPEEALQSYEASLPFLDRSDRGPVEDRIWQLCLAGGHDERAIEVWRATTHRHAEHRDCQLKAGVLLRRAGDLEGAREAFRRAQVLQSDDEGAELLCEVLQELAPTGTGSDRKEFLDTCLPRLEGASTERLKALLAAARETVRIEQALTVARALLVRDPESSTAHFVLGEAAEREGDAGTAMRQLRRALAGSELGAADAARARTLLAGLLTDGARASWEAASGGADASLVSRTKQAYLEALRLLGRAKRDGASVDRQIAAANEGLKQLGVMERDIGILVRREEQAACKELRGAVLSRYDSGRPVLRVVTSAVALAAKAGEAGSLRRLEAGEKVVLRDTDWTDGSCWYRVIASDASAGWASDDHFAEP